MTAHVSPNGRADPSRVSIPTVSSSSSSIRYLAAANQASESLALRKLDELVPNMPLAEIAQNTDSGTLRHTLGAAAHEVIDGRSILDRYLASFDLSDPRLKVVRNKSSAQPFEYSTETYSSVPSPPLIYPTEVARLMREGYSLVMDGMDFHFPEIGALTLLFERALGWQINTNGYVSFLSDDSFGFHWDDQEVFILPLFGRKSWEVGPPQALSMKKSVHPPAEEDSQITWSDLIGPGSCLHVPRGWAHRVRGIGELTFHLTVTCQRPTVLSVLGASSAALSPGTRSVVPVELLEADCRLKWTRDVAECLLERFAESYTSTVTQLRISIPSRYAGGISRQLRIDCDRDWFRNPHGGGWLVGPPMSKGVHEVSAGRRSWICSAAAIEALAAISQEHAVSCEQLLRDGHTREVVTEVAQSGIIDTVSSGGWANAIG